jgi:exopolysaccharide production protein ExoZ
MGAPIFLNFIHLSRGVAAILVVIFHTTGNLAKEKYLGVHANNLAEATRLFGEIGVCYFFALSGFLMHVLHHRQIGKPEYAWRYTKSRALRIYPPYIISFLLVYIVAQLAPSAANALKLDILTLLTSLSLLPQDKTVVGGTGAPVIIVAWSLQHEIIFYAAIGIGIIKKLFVQILLAVFTILIMLRVIGVEMAHPASFLSKPVNIIFIMGYYAGMLSSMEIDKIVKRMMLVLVGVCVMASLFFCMNYGDTSDNTIVSLTIGLMAATALSCKSIINSAQNLRINKNSIVNIVCDASYSIYLIHFPIVSILCKAVLSIRDSAEKYPMVAFFAILVTTIAISTLYHKYVETIILKSLARVFNKAKIILNER